MNDEQIRYALEQIATLLDQARSLGITTEADVKILDARLLLYNVHQAIRSRVNN